MEKFVDRRGLLQQQGRKSNNQIVLCVLGLVSIELNEKMEMKITNENI